jgi:hypothetical protein
VGLSDGGFEIAWCSEIRLRKIRRGKIIPFFLNLFLIEVSQLLK